MTTGNVSSAQIAAINMIGRSNTIFQDGAQVPGFESFLSNLTETGDATVKAISDTQVTSNKTRDELKPPLIWAAFHHRLILKCFWISIPLGGCCLPH